MLRIFTLLTLSLNLLLLLASDVVGEDKKIDTTNAPVEQKAVKTETTKKISSPTFKTIEWNDLIPEEDLNVLMNPPGYIDDLEDTAFDDDISAQLTINVDSAANDRYQQALVSTNIIEKMKHPRFENNKKISFLAEQLCLLFKKPNARRYSSSLLAMAALLQNMSPACYKQLHL